MSEIRSRPDDVGLRPATTLSVRLYKRTRHGETLKVGVPYIREDVPVMIVFRALGFVPDKDILSRICYNFDGALFQ